MSGRTGAAVGVAILVLTAACTDDPDEAPTTTAQEQVTSTTTARPEGPAADIGDELTGGDGVNIAASSPPGPVLDAAGYEQAEYLITGSATSYAVDGELTGDGRWTLAPAGEAPYRSRIVVRRPADAADASGTVVVEWLNVSGGLDADPDWTMLHEDITRNGDTWVGVSAQLIGINGGPVRVTTPESEAGGAGKGLRTIDPERYGSLDHPGDDFAFDIYTQVARALRSGGPALGDVTPEQVIAIGESQSAFALVTYINGVQPLTQAFDGFLVHSRGASGLPVTTPGQSADVGSALGGVPTTLRTDTSVPIVQLQSETDVTGLFNSAGVRQDDTDTYRLWEVAGTAHADTRLVGEGSEALGCGPINDGPMHVVAKAAYRALITWVRTGEAPPNAPRLDLLADTATPTLARDPDGIVLGGIRTPPVDVPVDVLSGEPGPSGETVCILSGQTTPLPPAARAARYSSRADYEERFEAAADDAVDAGFVLTEDRDALIAYADSDRVG